MKYIIETEMPLTEVWVAVSRDDIHALGSRSIPNEWARKSDGGWLKPLPVLPMKEVGEEAPATGQGMGEEDYEFAITSLSHGLKIVKDKRNTQAGLGGVEACLRNAIDALALKTVKQEAKADKEIEELKIQVDCYMGESNAWKKLYGDANISINKLEQLFECHIQWHKSMIDNTLSKDRKLYYEIRLELLEEIFNFFKVEFHDK